MGIKYININPHDDIKKSLGKANNSALHFLAGEMIAYMQPLIPYNPYHDVPVHLNESAKIEEIHQNEIEISYSRVLDTNGLDAEIAEDIYYGVNPVTGNPINKWTTEGTGAEWFERAKGEYSKIWYERYTRQWIDQFRF